jgi:anti-sigma factor RsiW
MNCREYQAMLTAYFDDELPERQKHEMDSHLARCPECRDLAQKLSYSLEIFKSLDGKDLTAELSPYLAEKIAAQLTDKGSEKPSLRTRLALAAGAIALVAGVFAGYLINTHFPGFNERDQGLNLTFQSNAIGFKIDQDNFILHSRDKHGEKGIDLKI